MFAYREQRITAPLRSHRALKVELLGCQRLYVGALSSGQLSFESLVGHRGKSTLPRPADRLRPRRGRMSCAYADDVQARLWPLQFPLSDQAYARSETAAISEKSQLDRGRCRVARWTSNPRAEVRLLPGPLPSRQPRVRGTAPSAHESGRLAGTARTRCRPRPTRR
jgi:hypothetical protein